MRETSLLRKLNDVINRRAAVILSCKDALKDCIRLIGIKWKKA